MRGVAFARHRDGKSPRNTGAPTHKKSFAAVLPAAHIPPLVPGRVFETTRRKPVRRNESETA